MNSLPCLTPPTVLLWLPSGVPGRRLFTRQNRPASHVFARNVWGIAETDDTKAALSGIEKTVAFFRSIGIPASLEENKDIGVQDDVTLHDLAYRCTYHRTRTIGTFQVLGEEEIYQIYKAANHTEKF